MIIISGKEFFEAKEESINNGYKLEKKFIVPVDSVSRFERRNITNRNGVLSVGNIIAVTDKYTYEVSDEELKERLDKVL